MSASDQAVVTERGALSRGRAALAVIGGRGAGALARRLRLGAGTSLPGLVAGRIDPAITARLGAQLRHGSVVITGTNGKTTTSGLTAYALRAGGLRVWRNREGANLLRGVTAALVIRARPHGNLRRRGDAAAVFEVDEAAFPHVVAALQPRVTPSPTSSATSSTATAKWTPSRNAGAPPRTRVARLCWRSTPTTPRWRRWATASAGPVRYRRRGTADGDTDNSEDDRERVDVMDARSCPRCRAPLTFTQRYYSHIGHWACPACGFAGPAPQVRRANVLDGLASARAFFSRRPDGEVGDRFARPLQRLQRARRQPARWRS